MIKRRILTHRIYFGYRTIEGDIKISELLCFVRCKFGTVFNLTLRSAIIRFCEAYVIYEAKRMLNDIASKNIKDAPTNGRRQDVGRKKR